MNDLHVVRNSIICILLLTVGLLISWVSTRRQLIGSNRDTLYSFFVAGHVYGSPGTKNPGLHPPFEKKMPLIKSVPGIAFGVLTGDIVSEATEKNWDEVDRMLKTLDMSVYFAVGNHDITDRDLYERRYGKTYFSFEAYNDLFIILDPNLDRWNISGEQLEFLKTSLKDAVKFNHIFVFLHQVLWWAPGNEYSYIKINSTEGRADQINFFADVFPLFAELPNEVYMFAGDVGATDDQMPTRDLVRNIHLITSGMGRGKSDNFLIVTVDENNQVQINVIGLHKVDLFAASVLE